MRRQRIESDEHDNNPAAPATTSVPPAMSTGPAITIRNAGASFVFATTPVAAGATVTVKNATDAQHTMTANTSDGGFDLTIDPGRSATFIAPMKAGSYGFHCNIHTDMQAKLTVT